MERVKWAWRLTAAGLVAGAMALAGCRETTGPPQPRVEDAPESDRQESSPTPEQNEIEAESR